MSTISPPASALSEAPLLRREAVAANTMAFWFARPPGFAYVAGQNALFSLIDTAQIDAYGTSRTFTIASAPHEDELMVATRMRNTAFKRALAGMPIGTRLRIDGPVGTMALHADESRPAVFLAAGIGVTPFRAMALDAAQRNLPHGIWLFHSNRRPEDAPFLDELRELEARHPRFKLVPTVTAPALAATPWRGETRRIGPTLLAEILPDVLAPIYYFAGPPGMTMEMRSMLSGLGVSADDMISEEFYGY
jgi:ferredoxin-NADP reductase